MAYDFWADEPEPTPWHPEPHITAPNPTWRDKGLTLTRTGNEIVEIEGMEAELTKRVSLCMGRLRLTVGPPDRKRGKGNEGAGDAAQAGGG